MDAGGLLATTAGIENEDFMAGRFDFDIPGNPGGTAVNRGAITVAEGGLAALVAPGVENSGTIRARLGRVALASGNAFTLDFHGRVIARDITLRGRDAHPHRADRAAAVEDAGVGAAPGAGRRGGFLPVPPGIPGIRNRCDRQPVCDRCVRNALHAVHAAAWNGLLRRRAAGRGPEAVTAPVRERPKRRKTPMGKTADRAAADRPRGAMRTVRTPLVLAAALAALTGAFFVDAAAREGDALKETAGPRVEGFRSARFGMSMSETREAIQRDFGLRREDIAEQPNDEDRTSSLVATVPDLFPDSDPAQLVYIHGYRQKS